MSKQSIIIGWIIIVLILAGFIIFAVKYSKNEVGDNLNISFIQPKLLQKQKIPEPEAIEPEQEIQPKQAMLDLITENNNFSLGKEFKVDIILDSQEQEVDGVDIILNYDPNILEALAEKVEKGEILTNFVFNQIDKETGIIRFSALSQFDQTFAGQGILASIDFKVLKPVQTTISFDFEQGLTEDTNIASQGQDILKQANNLEITSYTN